MVRTSLWLLLKVEGREKIYFHIEGKDIKGLKDNLADIVSATDSDAVQLADPALPK
jgi:hypothetical protein